MIQTAYMRSYFWGGTTMLKSLMTFGFMGLQIFSRADVLRDQMSECLTACGVKQHSWHKSKQMYYSEDRSLQDKCWVLLHNTTDDVQIHIHTVWYKSNQYFPEIHHRRTLRHCLIWAADLQQLFTCCWIFADRGGKEIFWIIWTQAGVKKLVHHWTKVQLGQITKQCTFKGTDQITK